MFAFWHPLKTHEPITFTQGICVMHVFGEQVFPVKKICGSSKTLFHCVEYIVSGDIGNNPKNIYFKWLFMI